MKSQIAKVIGLGGALVLVASLVPGCATNEAPSDSEYCESDGDCADGQVCDDETAECVADEEETCSDDEDCEYTECDESGNAVHYTGECQGDDVKTCSSTPEEIETCPAGCSDGECEDDECEDVTCDDPPEAQCDGDFTRVTYEDPGECLEGECQYAEVSETCEHGCSGGQCVDPCEQETCEEPDQDPRCDGNTGIVQETPGECRNESGQAQCYFDWQYNNCDYTDGVCDDDTGDCEDEVEQVGGVVVVEYMAHPRDEIESYGEWFEVVNTSGRAVDLTDWTIRSENFFGGDAEVHQIEDPPDFPDGARLLFARDDDPAGDGSVEPDYQYDEIALQNPSDTIEIIDDDGDVVDFVFWEEATVMEGRARGLDPEVEPSVEANDDFENWCPDMQETFGEDDAYGTPRASNSSCESDPCSDFTCEKPDDYCNSDGDAVQHTADEASCEVSRFNNPFCDYEPETVDCAEDETCIEGACEEIVGAVPEPGDLAVTEFMGDPDSVDDFDGEYLEIYNASQKEISLYDLTIEDDEAGSTHDSFTVDDVEASVPAGDYAVFAANTDEAQNGGISGAYELEDSALKNTVSSEGLTIRLVRGDGTVIDEARYGEPTTGASQQLDADAYLGSPEDAHQANDEADNYCDATTASSGYDAGDYGSPGADNESCGN
ncbi:MAG: lamin tail domain-containing protein [Persicimonas sp.]